MPHVFCVLYHCCCCCYAGCAHAAAGDTVDMHLGRTFVKSAPQATVEAAFADMVRAHQLFLQVLTVLLLHFITAAVQLCVSIQLCVER
jgi:hypothetical protein